MATNLRVGARGTADTCPVTTTRYPTKNNNHFQIRDILPACAKHQLIRPARYPRLSRIMTGCIVEETKETQYRVQDVKSSRATPPVSVPSHQSKQAA